MVKGETYDKQLFENDAFRHFINIFLNKQSGVTKGCEVTKDAQNITVAAGCFVIQGGLLKETTGTDNTIPTEAGYYKLVYEIDLSKTNNKDEFKQGSYKFVKALGDYPKLIQEDLDNGGTIYQLSFCQFRITETGLQDFKDLREIIDYGIYERKGEIVYENESGSKAEKITLQKEIDEFDEIQIDYLVETADYKISDRKRINIAKNKIISLYSVLTHTDDLQLYVAARYTFSGKNLVKNIERTGRIGGGATIIEKMDRIAITRIVAFKN